MKFYLCCQDLCFKVVLTNSHGEFEFEFKFYVTVEGGMDLRAMLMKRKVKQKKIVQKIIEWTEVRNNLLFKLIIRPVEARSLTACVYIYSRLPFYMFHYYLATTWSKMRTKQNFFDLRYSNGSFTSPINQF